MAKWSNAVITEQGKALMNKTMSGGTFTITKVKAGSGTVSLVDLRSQTKLVSEKQTLSIADLSHNEELTSVTVILTSEKLESSYNLQQIGFFAEDPDNGEILFAIAQDSDGNIIPSMSEMPMYSINFQFYFTIENDKSMAVTVDNASFVTNDMLQDEARNRSNVDKELDEKKVDKIDGKGLSTNDLTNDLKKNYDEAFSHTSDEVRHITSDDRDNWNAAKSHADSTHARTDATKVEKSSTNGNIKINGTETNVYTHPSGTNPHGTTKSDVGLGNADNTSDMDKPVSNATKLELDKKVNSDVFEAHSENTNNPHNVTKSQLGLGNVENKSSATIRGEMTKSNVTSALGYTPYTPNEVDNKIAALETNIDWKEAVATYDDIATTYPNPEDGWTVNVKDTDYTYRYNGTSWVAISANAIPKATNSVDGLLSKEDHTKYEDANNKKHTHSNKSILDSITQALIDNWSAAYSHISDTVKHITSKERTNWDAAKAHADSTHARTDATKVEKSSTNGNVLINGTETNVYTHPSGTNPHGTTKSDVGLSNVPNVATNDQTPTFSVASSRTNIASGDKMSVIMGKIMKFFADLKIVAFSGSYDDLDNKPSTATTSDDGFMSSTDKSKLDGIENGAQVNSVNGVKGSKETSYRTGNVNISPAQIGALTPTGETQANKTTFTSYDVEDENAKAWESVGVLTSGSTHMTLFSKISQMFKNVRYLYQMLGATDISSIGDGTVTDAISTLNSNLTSIGTWVSVWNNVAGTYGGYSFWVNKALKLAFIRFNGDTTVIPSANNKESITIPSSCKPIATFTFSIYSGNSSTGGAFIALGRDLSISIRVYNSSTGSWCAGAAVYPIE